MSVISTSQITLLDFTDLTFIASPGTIFVPADANGDVSSVPLETITLLLKDSDNTEITNYSYKINNGTTISTTTSVNFNLNTIMSADDFGDDSGIITITAIYNSALIDASIYWVKDKSANATASAEFITLPDSIIKFISNTASNYLYSPSLIEYQYKASNVDSCIIILIVDNNNNTYHYVGTKNSVTYSIELDNIFSTPVQIIEVNAYIIQDTLSDDITRNTQLKNSTVINTLLSATSTIIYDVSSIHVNFGIQQDMAKFAINAASITAAISNAGFKFSATGLTIDGGDFTILNQGNTIFKVDQDTGNIYIKGQVDATSGTIGAWTINEHGLISSNAGIYADDTVKINSNAIRFWSGKFNNQYNFYVTNDGHLYCSDAEITGNMYIQTGTVEEALIVGDADNGIIIFGGSDTEDSYISTAQFSSGILGNGWRLDQSGNATFTNAYIRGKITSAVFEYDGISSVGGSLYIAPTIYTTSESAAISVSDSYNVVSWTMEQSLNNFNGHTWKVGDGVKIDGNIKSGSTFEHVSNVSAIITSTENKVLTVKFKYQKNGTYTTYSGGTFTTGTAIIFYNDSEDTENKYGLYLTASDNNGPFLDVYDSTEVTSPAVRIGHLTGVTDTDFGGQLSGYGLYTSNAYLRGQLRLPNAGITNQTALNGDDDSPIRIWAGLPTNETDISKAYFIVTQSGSMYAQKGTFKGTVIAENSEFSGTIKAAGIVITDELSSSLTDHDHFFVAYTESPTTFDDYVLDISSSGLSIWLGGFKIYSDADSSNGVYGYSSTHTNPRPYVTVADDKASDGTLLARLVTNILHVTQTDYSSSALTYSTRSIIIEDGIWFNQINNSSTLPLEKNVFYNNNNSVGISYTDKLNVQADKIYINAQQEVSFNGRLNINNTVLNNEIALGNGIIRERKYNGTCLGFDFIVG